MRRDRKRRRRSNPLLSTEGFTDFYERHSEPLLVFCTRRVCDPDVALDLTAETFAQAFLSRRRFRGETEREAAAWLYSIARHQLARYFRRGKAERRAVERLGIEVPELAQNEQGRIEQLADLAGLRAAVANGLAQLSDSQREALRLRIVEELPYPEVARRLGVSEQTARARVSRGLRGLDRAMGPQPLAEEMVQ